MNYILLMGVNMPRVKVELEIDVPEGYEVVAKRKAVYGDILLTVNGRATTWFGSETEDEYIILRKVIKKRKVIKFRNCLMRSGDIVVWQLGDGTRCPDSLPDFVAWVGGWQQIEVEE